MSAPLLQPHPPLSGDPSPAAIIPPALLADLTSPALSLTDVASRHNLSLSELSFYISRTVVSNHLASLHVLAIEHARLLASFEVAQAVHILRDVLKRSTADLDTAEVKVNPAPDGPAPKSEAFALRAAAIRARRLETLRRAATTILNITRLNPPVFNYACAHALLERTLPPNPRHAPLQPTPPAPPSSNPTQVVQTPAVEPPAPAPEVEEETTDFPNIPPLKSETSGSETLTPLPLNFQTVDDPDLVTAGPHSPHEHWP